MSSGDYSYETKLAHLSRPPVRSHGFVNEGVFRGSTVLQESCAAMDANGKKPAVERMTTYGTSGGPTHFALEDLVAQIEGGKHCIVVQTGLAAITLPLLAYLKAGQSVLMPDSVYGPTRRICNTLLKNFGIETVYYDPCLDAAGLEAIWPANAAVLFMESPGSHTFEMQDVSALAAVAKKHGAKAMLDNTWGIHHFQPFKHGVDVSIQALTKYVGGHSDVLLGGVTVNDTAEFEVLRLAATTLGYYASPDDCWLALRGARTMAVRMAHQEKAALAVAQWFTTLPQVKQVRHPALPGAPGHEIWKRDFTGACSLFGVVFDERYTEAQIFAFVDSLKLFGIGASWGGYECLALPTAVTRTATPVGEARAVRFHIGLENVDDIIADIRQALVHLPA
ncbi:cystathionine beta-lyase [Acetobacteraceae bacterium H6797]|nr:cystathionine beta-lyase [Acetobacteraceae bacterium H6797]